MAIPLGVVLAAAPDVIALVSGLLKAAKKLRASSGGTNEATIKEIEAILEKQAAAMIELAENNRNLALAVKTNRVIAMASLVLAVGAWAWVISR